MSYYVYSIIYLIIFLNQIFASCPYIRTSVILAECVFDTNLYLSLGAHIFNSNSIHFLGQYSFNNTENLFNNTLIYNLGHRWMLLLPLLLKCSQQPINITFTECQYTMRQSKSSIGEYMTTQLSVINMTNLGMQSVLFLQPGEIILRSCKAYDCSKQLVYLTASNETFHLQINYEKTLGTKCQINNDCNNPYSLTNLIQCDQISQTCQCLNENITTIEITDIGRLCIDSIDQSNCTKSSQRCLRWCNESKTSHCICPKYTRKVKKINGFFDCELEPTSICRFDDDDQIGLNIRKCPTGTFCDGNHCRSLTIYRQMYEEFSNESLLISSTLSSNLSFSLTTNFFRILIIIAILSLLFFILILFIIAMLIKSHRFRLLTLSKDKISSSSFAPSSTTTAISADFSNEIYQFKPQSFMSKDYSRRYEDYFSTTTTNPTFISGLVPQTNLSPRFYRQYQGVNERQRQKLLHVQSPSLSYINHKRTHSPTITHLQNGDVLISA